MAQHDFEIDNSTGQNVRIDINNVLKAILTNNSGTTDPSTVIASGVGSKAYSFWADTNSSPAVLKIRNSSDNGWIELFQLDGTLTLEDGSASTPGLAFRDDLDTGIFSSAVNTFNVATAGVERMELGATTIFNEDGADVDFRIEGDTEANLFYVDAGNDSIGIGTSSPVSLLHIESSSAPTLRIDDSDTSGALLLQQDGANGSALLSSAGTFSIGVSNDNSAATLTFLTRNNEHMRLDSGGRLLLGTTTEGHAAADELTIENTAADMGITLRSSSSHQGAIYFSDGTSGDAEYRGIVSYNHANDALSVYTAASERMRIDSSGRVRIGGVTGPNSALLFVAGAASNNYIIQRNTTASDADGGRWNNIRFQGTQSGGEVSTLAILQANHHGSADDEKGNFEVLINDGNDGDTLGVKVRIDSDGLKFNADTAATNAINDYEEGFWTPTVSNPTGITLVTANGQYRKIGNEVFASFEITFPSTSGSDLAILAGLPFTSGTTGQSNCGGVAKDYHTVIDQSDGPIYHIPQNNTQIQIYRDSGQNMQIGQVSGGNFRGVAIYFTD